MEKFERFSEERLTSLRARYRGDDFLEPGHGFSVCLSNN